MNVSTLFRKSMLVLALVALCGGSFAQGTKEKSKREKKTGDNFFSLNLKGEIGLTTSVDRSIIPFAFSGLAKGLDVGFTDEWKRCHIQFDFDWMKTNYSSPMGTMNYYSPKLEFLYSCLKPSDSRWHFWSGASMRGIVDIKNIPELGNASATVSVFGNFTAEELVQCDFAYEKSNPSHPWMTAFFKFSLPLFSIDSRPKFAYVQHPMNVGSTVQQVLASNEKSFKMFPGFGMDLGFTVNLRNGNRFSFGYCEDFLTTGKKGAYRYDNSYNTFYLQFMFKI